MARVRQRSQEPAAALGRLRRWVGPKRNRVVVDHHASAPQAEEVVATVTAAGGEAVAIKADVTVPNDVTAMVDEIDQRWGGIDVLVHSVSTPFPVTSFAKLSWEQLGGKLEQRAARRLPHNEGRCAGNAFSWLRAG